MLYKLLSSSGQPKRLRGEMWTDVCLMGKRILLDLILYRRRISARAWKTAGVWCCLHELGRCHLHIRYPAERWATTGCLTK
jgi:hypothetical protein